MSRWETVSLGDVAEITAGNPAPQDAKAFDPEGRPFVRMQDVGRSHHTPALTDTVDRISPSWRGRTRLKLFPKGSLLIPKSGASINSNHRALLDVDAHVVTHLAVVIPNRTKIDPQYLFWWSVNYDPRHQAQVTSLPSLPLSILRQAHVPLPPLPEQRRIVDILNRADGIRRLRHEAQEKARQLIPALFVEMFGDPGAIPTRHIKITLGDIIVSGPQNGLYRPKSAYGEGTPILRINNFYGGLVDPQTELLRLRLAPETVAKYALNNGDIVINRVNSRPFLGKSALIPTLNEPTVFESNVMRFSVDSEMVVPDYLIAALQHLDIKRQILARAKDAINQSSINQTDVKDLTVLLPPIRSQRAFAERVADIQAMITQQDHMAEAADDLMASLMAQAFDGRL